MEVVIVDGPDEATSWAGPSRPCSPTIRARAVEGPVAAMVAASALHPHVTVVVDEAAASGLALADYYRETWANKPRWQGI